NMIADRHVAAENRVVGKNDVVSDRAVMPYMRTHHEKTAVTNFRNATIIFGAGAHGYVFADVAIVAPASIRAVGSIICALMRRTAWPQPGPRRRPGRPLLLRRDTTTSIYVG